MDVIGEFLEDCVTVRQNAQVTAKALYRAYRKWTEETGQNAVTQTRFGLALQERDFRKVRASGGVIYQGIELPMSDAWQPE
jgi:putative DNA primase/helicase